MKKIVLIATVLLSSINLNAQEKQNDATWEETIEFLKEYVPKFNHTQKRSAVKPNAFIYQNFKYSIKENTFYFNYSDIDISASNQKYQLQYNLLILSDIYLKKDSFDEIDLVLEFDNGVQKSHRRIDLMSLRVVKNGNINVKYFVDPNGEEVARLIKAFKHLAYLAKEKRKEKQKHSKF